MSLLSENTRRWNSMVVKPQFAAAGRKFAARALRHKDAYVALSEAIKTLYNKHVPWWFIPLVHERECVGGVDNWTCNIAQGWAFNQKSKNKPYNGPFSSWRVAAIQALVNEAPHAASNTNWSGGGLLTIGEQYNGLGYANKGRPSPYVWSGTNQYVKGKYVADGKYDPNAVDSQLGMAVALKMLMEADPTITLDGDLPKQDSEGRTSEATVTTGFFVTVLAFINTNPWFVFTWWDISFILAGTLFVTAIIVNHIIQKKKGVVDAVHNRPS